MQQIIQPIDGQELHFAEVPAPLPGPHEVLIANHFSVISAGTERQTVELARSSLIQKARQRPDHVRRVLEKLRQEGLAATIRQIRARLDQPMPMGYSSAGVVLAVGEQVREFHVGDRVASNGPHSEIVAVSKNLVAKVPDDVTLDRACFAVIAAIALQGVRLAKVGLGDVVAVIGLGLVGQVVVSLLKSAGCKVIGTDPDPEKRRLALDMGADEAVDAGTFTKLTEKYTKGYGADAVLVAASTTSNGPMELAAQIARPKAKLVMVGAVSMNVPRRDFYFKELELVVSCSYGPGRYDRNYEEHGQDYPIGQVRWTEQRNIAAVLSLMSTGQLPVEKLITHRFAFRDAPSAYELVESKDRSYCGIVLDYPRIDKVSRRIELPKTAGNVSTPRKDRLGVSVIGAGSFAAGVLIPQLAKTRGVELRGLVSAKGLSARTVAKKNGFAFAASDFEEVLVDPATDVLVIATRHDEHWNMASKALRAGKHVFVEKPLVLSEDELDDCKLLLADLCDEQNVLTVGFNRRFSPLAQALRSAISKTAGPRQVLIRFNAGNVPADHWVHDPLVGGGRILGEVCHAVDLAGYLVGSRPVATCAKALSPAGEAVPLEDDVSMRIDYADGSIATILYTSGGDRSAGKERIEVFGGGFTAFLDDFRSLRIHHGGKCIMSKSLWSQQKGFAKELSAFVDSCRTGAPTIPYESLIDTSEVTLHAVSSLRSEAVIMQSIREHKQSIRAESGSY